MLVILRLPHLLPDSSSALLFCSMRCDVTPMNCIAQAPLLWPSVGFVQWEALVGDPKAGGEREDGAFTYLAPCLLPYSPPRLCLLSDSPPSPPRPCPGSGKGILSPDPTMCLCFLTVAEPWVLHRFLHGSQDFVHISCK